MSALIKLSDEQTMWFKESFPRMRNQDIADKLGCGISTVKRMAARLGVEKDREYLLSALCVNTKKARETIERLKTRDPKKYKAMFENRIDNIVKSGNAHQFKKGETLADRIGEDRAKESYRKALETRESKRNRDRMRVRMGLEPKTNMPLGQKATWYDRRMRKKLAKYGYIVNGSKAYYTAETNRSRCEKFIAKRYGIEFLHIEAKEVYRNNPNWNDRQGGFNNY